MKKKDLMENVIIMERLELKDKKFYKEKED
jgi:hypothetical protein